MAVSRVQDPAEVNQQARVTPPSAAPADIPVGPHQKARGLRAIGICERALLIIQHCDAGLIWHVTRDDGDNSQVCAELRADLRCKSREIWRVSTRAMGDENVPGATQHVEQAQRKADAVPC